MGQDLRSLLTTSENELCSLTELKLCLSNRYRPFLAVPQQIVVWVDSDTLISTTGLVEPYVGRHAPCVVFRRYMAPEYSSNVQGTQQKVLGGQ